MTESALREDRGKGRKKMEDLNSASQLVLSFSFSLRLPPHGMGHTGMQDGRSLLTKSFLENSLWSYPEG